MTMTEMVLGPGLPLYGSAIVLVVIAVKVDQILKLLRAREEREEAARRAKTLERL